MNSDSMNERQRALLGYLFTIALDSRVRPAKSLEALWAGVRACVQEDIQVIGVQFLRRAVISRAEPLAEKVVDRALAWLDDVLSPGKQKK